MMIGDDPLAQGAAYCRGGAAIYKVNNSGVPKLVRRGRRAAAA